MRQGNLRFWEVGMVVLVPSMLALLGGILLASISVNRVGKQVETDQLADLAAQTRMVAGNVLEELQTARAQALTLAGLSAETGDSRAMNQLLKNAPGILLWLELENKNGLQQGIRRSLRQEDRGISLSDGFTHSKLLQALVGRLPIESPAPAGDSFQIFRIKPDASRTPDALGLLFAVPDNPQRAVLAVLDPSKIFNVFERWGKAVEGNGSRGYVIGADGYILAHSQGTYVGARFGQGSFFDGPVREALSGGRPSGSGVYRAVDQVEVLASVFRPGNLPFGVVVEKVKESAAAPFTRSTILGYLGLVLLWVIAGAGTLLYRLRLSDSRTVRALKESPVIEGSPTSPKGVRVGPVSNDSVISLLEPDTGNQGKSEPEVSSAVQAFQSKQEARFAAVMESQMTENALKKDLGAKVQSPNRGVATVAPVNTTEAGKSPPTPTVTDSSASGTSLSQEQRVVLARFEIELERLASSGDLILQRRGFQRLTSLVRETSGRPVLFFQYHPLMSPCVLAAHAGANYETIPKTAEEGLSIPVSTALEEQLKKAAQSSQILALADYAPLAAIINRKWRAQKFEAFAVQGFRKGKLIGLLVVLDVEKSKDLGIGSEELSRLIRSTGHYYENAFLKKNGEI